VLDDEKGVRGIDFEQFAGCKLVVQPIDAAVLEVSQWIMPSSAGQLVLSDYSLLLPCVDSI
jgi:hypothetical protein